MKHDSWNLEGYERLRAAVVEQAVKNDHKCDTTEGK